MTIVSNRKYAYIDGESHFIRSENAWKKIHGSEACLERLRYVRQADDRLILVQAKAKVFWTRRMNPDVERATYFTSLSGDSSAEYNIRVALRDFELEPFIVTETNDLRKKRQHLLETSNVIEKPKGVDIEMAVQALQDAYQNKYDECHLYTSDVDFIPAIKAIRTLGKRVRVFGYSNGLSKESPFLHVPEQFIDLNEMLRTEYELAPQI